MAAENHCISNLWRGVFHFGSAKRRVLGEETCSFWTLGIFWSSGVQWGEKSFLRNWATYTGLFCFFFCSHIAINLRGFMFGFNMEILGKSTRLGAVCRQELCFKPSYGFHLYNNSVWLRKHFGGLCLCNRSRLGSNELCCGTPGSVSVALGRREHLSKEAGGDPGQDDQWQPRVPSG